MVPGGIKIGVTTLDEDVAVIRILTAQSLLLRKISELVREQLTLLFPLLGAEKRQIN